VKLARIGLSIEHDLLKWFDDAIARKNHDNRSEAIRELIRDQMIAEEVDRTKSSSGLLLLSTIIIAQTSPRN
jgi:CopG family transcriptional regulator, nickel-responsive regulator